MKRVPLLSLMLCLFLQINAQTYVSTSVQNRNAIIEEFTGRDCHWCPLGHAAATQIMANNPGRVWTVSIHAGYFSPTSYPNLNTTDGNTICTNYNVTGFPSGLVNRTTTSILARDEWEGAVEEQLAQTSEVNVAGVVDIDTANRIANITVEVYYTSNSTMAENRLTVLMIQDSIMGYQENGESNPSQMLNGEYVQLHTLRDIITETWGEIITPTTQGTLITKTYSYPIPLTIGNPNGPEVKIPHIHFIAFVSENNANHTNILSANILPIGGTEEPCFVPSNLDGVYQWNNNEEFGVKIEFDAPDVTPLHYNIYRSLSNENYEIIAEVESADSHVIFFDSTDVNCYYYQVTAYHDFGDRTCESEPAESVMPGSNYVNVCVTDVNDNSEQKMSVFPNPANETLTFTNDANNEVIVFIYDLKGQEVMNFSFTSSKTIELENMSAGVYMVRMVGDSVLTKRIIVK